MRLFCFSHAGGGASVYRGWAEGMEEGIDVFYIQLPGRENRIRETPFTSMLDLSKSIAEVLVPYLDRPYAFFGHSMGSLVAYEVSRVLHRNGNGEPQQLFVAASRAPHLPWPHAPIRHLPPSDLLHEIHRRYGSVPAQLLENIELQELLTPTLRADFTIVETYRYHPGQRLASDITVFGGKQDRMVTLDALDAWREHTLARFQTHLLDGGHFFVQTAREQLLRLVSESLRTAALAR